MARLDGRVHAELGGELEVHHLVPPLEAPPVVPLDQPVDDAGEEHHPGADQVCVPGNEQRPGVNNTGGVVLNNTGGGG